MKEGLRQEKKSSLPKSLRRGECSNGKGEYISWDPAEGKGEMFQGRGDKQWKRGRAAPMAPLEREEGTESISEVSRSGFNSQWGVEGLKRMRGDCDTRGGGQRKG